MGEIAESILNGDFCQYCMEYLGDGDGYPRTCHACIEDGMEDHLEEESDEIINLDEIIE